MHLHEMRKRREHTSEIICVRKGIESNRNNNPFGLDSDEG